MDKHHGLKRVWLMFMFVIPLILGVTSWGEGAYPPPPEPPANTVKINGPRVGGTVTVMFVADIVRDADKNIDKEWTVGIGTTAAIASCKGEQFVLGPVLYSKTISMAEFETLTSVAELEKTGFGYVAPQGCFSTLGGEFLDIDTVIQYKINSVTIYKVLDPSAPGGMREELRAMVVVDVIIGGYQ